MIKRKILLKGKEPFFFRDFSASEKEMPVRSFLSLSEIHGLVPMKSGLYYIDQIRGGEKERERVSEKERGIWYRCCLPEILLSFPVSKHA